MTNKEAIEVLTNAIPEEGYMCRLQVSHDSDEHKALRLAVIALEYQSKKEQTMTNKEAIEILDKCHSGYTQEKVQTAYNMAKEALRAQADKEQPMNITTAIAITKDVMSDYESPITKEALGMAVDALKEKAEKERRYVVMSQFPLQHRVFDTKREVGVADRIATREAAQAIADIYEGMEG